MIRKKYILITTPVLLANLFLDRITKYLAVTFLKGEEMKSFLWDIVRIVYAENTGAFLSLGNGWPIVIKYIVFIIIPVTFCFYGLYYCFFKENDTVKTILFATIIGGGLGNLIDRVFYNFSVVDFLNFGISSLRTGILNVADLSVTFGVLFFILYEISQKSLHNQTQ